MRRLLRSLILALAVSAPVGFALAGPSGDCRSKAVEALRVSSPGGFAIYEQTSDKHFFRSWIDCEASQYDLSTAVHESTHFITSETDAFPLVGGGALPRPHEVSEFFAPYKIAGSFEADDFTRIYLRRGKASSSTDFLYLLDEFNAYAHDLNAAVDLRALSSPDEVVDHRDGLAAMMAFIAVYAETARASEPDTWSGLRQPRAATTIATLWRRAEEVMAKSCGIPDFGTSDKAYIGQVCAADPRSALAQILGRAPACPAACLEPSPDLEQTGSEVKFAASRSDAVTRSVETMIDDQVAPERPRHPFAGNAGPRRHRLRVEAD